MRQNIVWNVEVNFDWFITFQFRYYRLDNISDLISAINLCNLSHHVIEYVQFPVNTF
jgi:hypothetical protein